MIQAYVDFWANYANFSGRTSRAGYWWPILCNFIISILLSMLISIFGTILPVLAFIPLGISFVFNLAQIIPSLAVMVRRLHDTNKPWYYLFWGLIPLAGVIILIVFFCQAGDASENQYGEDPLTFN